MSGTTIIHMGPEIMLKQVYDDLVVKYNEVKKENDKLKDDLLIERNRYSEVKKDVSTMEEELILLKKENIELREELKKRDKQIETMEEKIGKLEINNNELKQEMSKLGINNNELVQEKKYRDQLTIVSEIITKYKEKIINDIYKSKHDNVKFGKLVNNEEKLTEEQKQRLDLFKNKFNSIFNEGFTDFKYYLNNFPLERHIFFHKINSNMTDKECRENIYSYIEKCGGSEAIQEDYKLVADLILEELGKTPLKNKEESKRRLK
jgi:predicted nuclease with TOPRIM domain